MYLSIIVVLLLTIAYNYLTSNGSGKSVDEIAQEMRKMGD